MLNTPSFALEMSPRWVYAQDVASRAIEPGDQDQPVANLDVREAFEHRRVEDQPASSAPASALAAALLPGR